MNTKTIQIPSRTQAKQEILAMPVAKARLLAVVSHNIKRFKKSFHKETTLAKQGSISRTSVQRYKPELEQEGYFSWTKNDHAATPTYYPLHKLLDNDYQEALRIYLPLVIGFSLFSLLVKPLWITTEAGLYLRFKDICNISLSPESTARVRATLTDNRKDKKGGMETDRTLESWLTPTLRTCTEKLSLTKWGQIRLASFSDEVLKHALSQLAYAKPQNLYMWFFKVCLEYCSHNKILPQWTLYEALAKMHNQPPEPQLSLATTKKNDGVSPSNPKTSNQVRVKELFPVYQPQEQKPLDFFDKEKMETIAYFESKETLTDMEKTVLAGLRAQFGK